MLEHEMMGQTARAERYIANLLFTIAAGERIDKDRSERFSAQAEAAYANPFHKTAEKEMTAEEIRQHVMNRLEGLLHGSA